MAKIDPAPNAIVAVGQTRFGNALPLSLIALSEADTQSGGVLVEGEGIRLTIESTGAEARPLASTNPLRVETRVAAFRYDPKNSPLIVVRVSGSHFLWKMVRRLVGVLVEVGRGGLAPGDMPALLASRSELPAKLTAPASGLFLERVDY